MTDEKTYQQSSDINYQYPIEEETSFIDILAVIVKKKGLIFLFTSIFTLLSIVYLYIGTPVYVATISFLPPTQETYLSSIDPKLFTQSIDFSEDSEKGNDKKPEIFSKILENFNSDNFLYRQFLVRVQSFNQQKEVLLNKNISKKFFGESPDIESLDQSYIALHNAISFNNESLTLPNKDFIPLDKPVDLLMEGPNPIAMAAFLNTLTEYAKTAIIKETQDSLKALVDNRLNLAISAKEHLRFKDHLNKIKDYSKKIQTFSDSLKIAQSLNIKNNNFHLLKKTVSINRFTVVEQIKLKHIKALKDVSIPQWFLYGEKALTEEIKVLKSKVNQFISNPPETAQNLNKNNDNYIDGLTDLEALIKQLKSFEVNTLVPKVVLIVQPSTPPIKPVNLEEKKVLPVGIGLGLLIGIIAAFLSHSMELLRNKNTID